MVHSVVSFEALIPGYEESTHQRLRLRRNARPTLQVKGVLAINDTRLDFGTARPRYVERTVARKDEENNDTRTEHVDFHAVGLSLQQFGRRVSQTTTVFVDLRSVLIQDASESEIVHLDTAGIIGILNT
jgi:hypothetical protein